MTNNPSNEFTNNNLDKKTKKLYLLQQELDVNLQQQVIVNQRINVIKESFHDISNTDPQYSVLFTQMEMDQVELDELKKRENDIKKEITSC